MGTATATLRLLEEKTPQDRFRKRDKLQNFLQHATLRLYNSLNCLLLARPLSPKMDSSTQRRGGVWEVRFGRLFRTRLDLGTPLTRESACGHVPHFIFV